MFKSATKYLLLAAALTLAPSAASAATSYPFIEPSITAVEALGAACSTTVAGVWIPNVGHYAWNGSSTATADGANVLQCTGVATGRMIIDPGFAGKVYANVAAIDCTSDLSCAAIPNITIQTVTLGGITGAGDYEWDASYTGTPSNDFYIQPAGATHAYKMTGFFSSGYLNVHLSQYLNSGGTLSTADTACAATGRPCVLDDNVSLAANTTLTGTWECDGGIITRGTYTLTMPFPICGATQQMFDAAGTGLITFTGNNKEPIHTAWFGAQDTAIAPSTSQIVPVQQTTEAATASLSSVIWDGMYAIDSSFYPVDTSLNCQYSPPITGFALSTGNRYTDNSGGLSWIGPADGKMVVASNNCSGGQVSMTHFTLKGNNTAGWGIYNENAQGSRYTNFAAGGFTLTGAAIEFRNDNTVSCSNTEREYVDHGHLFDYYAGIRFTDLYGTVCASHAYDTISNMSWDANHNASSSVEDIDVGGPNITNAPGGDIPPLWRSAILVSGRTSAPGYNSCVIRVRSGGIVLADQFNIVGELDNGGASPMYYRWCLEGSAQASWTGRVDVLGHGDPDYALEKDNINIPGYFHQNEIVGAALNSSASATRNPIIAGALQLPSNPAFSAYVTSTSSAVTGSGTPYTVAAFTSNYDLASNFTASTGVFVAPVAGVYNFSANLFLGGLGATETGGDLSVEDTTSGLQAYIWAGNAYTYGGSTGNANLNGSASLYMAAGDSASLILTVTGGTSNTVTVNSAGSATQISYFQGKLAQ